MSSAGNYIILNNTGPQDEILNATKLLAARIEEYQKNNPVITDEDQSILPGKMNAAFSTTPTLNYIEKTHNTFVNSTFKPYIAMGSQYNKVTSGNARLGRLSEFDIPQKGDFFNDMVLHVQLTGLSAIDPRDRTHYVAFLGHRLLESVKFVIKLNPIAEYGPDEMNAYYDHELPLDQKESWLKNIGQEIPIPGFLTSNPSYDMIREYRYIGNGNQTLKQKHDVVDLFIPLIFWFRNIKSSIPGFLIPWGQTFVTVQFAPANEIVGFADYGGGGLYNDPTISVCDLYINSLYVSPEITNLCANKFTFSLVRLYKTHKETIAPSNGNASILLNNIRGPVETMYIRFRPRINLTLSQYWNRNTSLTEKTYKVPVVTRLENTVITGTIIAVSTNVDGTVNAQLSGTLSSIDGKYDDYNFNITSGRGFNSADITQSWYMISSYVGSSNTITLTTGWTLNFTPIPGDTFELYTPQLAIGKVVYYEEKPVIDSFTITISGNKIIDTTPEQFFNTYIPYRFGQFMGYPSDRGSYMVAFNLFPGHFQPSGSINSSQGREMYLNFISSVINASYPVDVIVVGKCINFLVIQGGSGVLKYAT